MDISLALDTLRTATDEALQSRYSEISLTLSIIGQRLQVRFLATTPATIDTSTPPPSDSERDSPSSIAGSTLDRPNTENTVGSLLLSNTSELAIIPVQPTANAAPKKGPNPGENKKSTVEKLVHSMKDHIDWLWDNIHTENEIISRKRDPSVDIRMEDYRRVEGNRRPSNQDKLLRLLSMRSLAKDFVQETYGKDRLQTIIAYVLSIQSGNLGPENSKSSQLKGRCRRVSEFVKLHPLLSSYHDANRAINKGIKHLVFETVFKKTLEDLKLPNMSKALSAILGLSMNDFKSLTYAQMPQLVDAVVDGAFSIPRTEYELQGQKFDLPNVIHRIDRWFARVQTQYNNVRRTESIPEFPRPHAKRARYSNQTGGQQNSPYYSTYQGSSNFCTLPISIENTTQPELQHQNEVHELPQNQLNEVGPPLLANNRPPSEINSLLENFSPDELDGPIDYTFQGASNGTQQIWTDIETQPVDYAIAYNPTFAELAPFLSAHPFDFSLAPIQSDFDDPGPSFST